MINLLITLCVIAACFYWGILYENVKILICGLALGILLLLSMLELLYRLYTITCRLEIPIAMAEQNQPVVIGIGVENKGGLTCGKVQFRMSIHNAFTPKMKKKWFTLQQVYVDKMRYDYPITISEAGCLEVELSKIRIYAFTRLLYVTKKCKQYDTITVMPQLHSIGVRTSEAVRNFVGDADVYDDVRPGHDPAETFDIRPYREKDKLQSIHWKLSVKTDDLMVRENSLPMACAVVVLLDLEEGIPKEKKRNASFGLDGFLEVVASLALALLDNKIPYFVAWYSKEKGEIVRTRVDDEESFYLFLSVYLQDGTITNKFRIREAYKEKYRGEYYIHDLLVNRNLDIYKNGEFVTKIDKTKIVDECEKLEILL